MSEEMFTRRIAALHGEKGQPTQSVLAGFAQKLAQEGVRVAGVVEIAACGGRGGCKKFSVRDLTSGETISITQDLGPHSDACALDPAGLIKACGRVEQAISGGVDLVILSKFGKLEAARSGLTDAFRAAMVADVPVITVVPTAVEQDWERFAGPLSQFVEPSSAALEAWWLSQGQACELRDEARAQ
ncbi:MAG TPA: DUF2478 domain-containing protein [Methylocystis sp.]|nr:DUF2478 domain-containing protein [Methylocystis sp.]